MSACGYSPCSEPVGTHGLKGYKNGSNTAFFVNNHYTGGGGCINGPCNRFLFYTGHSGFDYPQTLRTTEIIAPADGLLYVPASDPIIPGDSVNTFFILALDHGNGFASWFLHVGCEAGTVDSKGKVLCPAIQDFRGIDANGNVVCSHTQLVTTGCPVQQGDVIGLVGNKGLTPRASFAHLHFEVRKGIPESLGNLPSCDIQTCVPVDPYGWNSVDVQDPYSQFLGGLPSLRLWK